MPNSTFYSDLAATALRLLTDKGQQVTFSRETATAFNPVVGSSGAPVISTFTAYGAAFDYNKSEIDGTLVKRGDIRFLMNASATAPALGDTVIIDSITYRVMNVKPTSPGGTVVIYEVQLRK